MEKKFDAVKYQRKIREQLSKEYLKKPNFFLKELKEKFGSLQKQQVH